MTPDEAAEIFKAETASYIKINIKPTFVDTSDFEDKAKHMLVDDVI